MAFGTIRMASAAARALGIACLAFVLILAFLFAKWSFANAISTRSADKDAADLAVSLAPADPQTHFAAAVVYDRTFDRSDLEISLAEYKRAAELSPNNYLAWLELARARDRAGENEEAQRAYERAIELAPNYAAVQWAYGNFLVRTGRSDEGFPLIRRSVAADPTRSPSAVSTFLAYFDGDTAKVRELLGNTGAVNLAIAAKAISAKDADAAFEAWSVIPPDERRTAFRDESKSLATQLAAAKRFRLAATVTADIADDAVTAPVIAGVTNGGFERLDLGTANIFDWQLSAGPGQQIGLNTERKSEGAYSLFMVFNTMKTAEFRQLSQTVAVEPGGVYQLRGSYRSELKGLVAWEIADAADGKVLERTKISPVSDDWVTFETIFTVPPTDDGIVVRLVRDGCVGAVCPISGKLWLDGISLSRTN